MTNPGDVLKLTYPYSVNVSTPGNPSVVSLRFAVANVSISETVTLPDATLLVPVSTAGTNLTSGAMRAVCNRPGWTFASDTTSPEVGYAAFRLLPTGDGTIPPGGSVGFELTGVTVNDIPTPAAATLPFAAAKTSLGRWQTQAVIQLNPASTVPFIARDGTAPPIILQGETTVISWAATGAAYCQLSDDQGNTLGTDLPIAGPLAPVADVPVPGHSPSFPAPNGGNFYIRTYTLTANSAGDDEADQRHPTVLVRQPTIIDFAVAPEEPEKVKPGDQVAVSWSVANVHRVKGRITLTVAPQDGTPAQQIKIPLGTPDSNGLFSGSGIVTPTPLARTHYTLTIDNGFGARATQSRTVASALQLGLNRIATLPIDDEFGGGLASFGGRVWSTASSSAESVLLWSRDGAAWTRASPPPGVTLLFGPGALAVANLGEGDVLCVWGYDAAMRPLVAWTRDAAAWHPIPLPPTVDNVDVMLGSPAGLLVFETQVWLRGPAGWTQVGNSFPVPSNPVMARRPPGFRRTAVRPGSRNPIQFRCGFRREARCRRRETSSGSLVPDCLGTTSSISVQPSSSSTRRTPGFR